MPPILETERLTLRPLQENDVEALFAIYSDPRAMAFMPILPHEKLEQSQQLLDYQRGLEGATYWAVCLKGQQRMIGQVNYLAQTRVPGMGYITHPDYWGEGYTPEACRAALDYGFGTLGYDRVELWIDETNSASSRVAQKLGFKVRGRLPNKYRHTPNFHFMLVWGMFATEWRNEADAESPTRFFGIEPVLYTHDVQATAEFYRDKLGFHLDFLYGDPPDHAGVSRGEWSGSLVSLQLTQVPLEREIKPSANLHIRVDSNLDRLYEQYRTNGIEIIAAPDDKPWGFREFAIKDHAGHVLIFGALL